MTPKNIFLTGGTGYVGRALISALLARGHTVRALVRSGSERRLPPGPEVIVGDALRAETFAAAVPQMDTFVHLVGTPHPSPSKALEFQRVDLASIRAAVTVAEAAGVKHFVYVSVAHPAPVMHAYIAVRRAGEEMIRESHLPATVLRPWYILGPGHRWPYLLLPIYWVLSAIPSTAEGARRLGLVTHQQTVTALVRAIEDPPTSGMRILGVPHIRGRSGS